MSNWDNEDVLYKPELLTIVEYIVDSNCYRAKPFFTNRKSTSYVILQQIGGVSPFTDTAYGKVSTQNTILTTDSKDTVQNTFIYSPQTAVMALVPRSLSNNPTDNLVGFIIGKVSSPYFYRNTNKNKQPIQEIQDIKIDNIFGQTNKLNQTHVNIDVKNNLSCDVMPGDLIQRGTSTYTLMDNYMYSVGTDLTKTVHFSLTGEISDTCMLKQERTIYSDKTTYVIGSDILKLDKYAANTKIAGLDCFDYKNQTLSMVKDPLYTYVEAFGEVIDGNYTTKYTITEDANNNLQRVPVYQTNITNDGKYSLKSSTRITLSKTVTQDFREIDCTGPHFKPIIDNTFINTYPDIQEDNMDVLAEKDSPFSDELKKAISVVDMQEDGSILLKDGWGSYIKLTHGNIQIHAANDIFFTANRDFLTFTGGTESHWAHQGVQLDTGNEGNVSIRAGLSLKVNTKILSVTTDTSNYTINKRLRLNSPIISIADDVNVCPCITIGAGNGRLVTQLQESCIFNHNRLDLSTPNSCITLYNSTLCEITANINLSGSLNLTKIDKVISIGAKEYPLPKLTGSIFITEGGLYAAHAIASTVSMQAPSICASMMGSTVGILGRVENFNMDNVIKVLASNKAKTASGYMFKIPENLKEEEIADLAFKFNPDIGFNAYIAENSEFIGNFKDIITQQGYIYPGEAFWEMNGIHYVDDENNDKKIGFRKYKYN